MEKVWRMLSILAFLLGAGVLLQRQLDASGVQRPGEHPSTQNRQIDVFDTEPARSFVMTYADSKVSPDGSVMQTGRTMRYVKTNGEWRQELRSNGHSDALIYGGGSDGVFRKERSGKTEARRYVSSYHDESILRLYRSRNYLRTHPELVRTDEVAGLEVFVLRTYIMNPESPEEWIETSYSPKTGNTMLGVVSHLRDGSEIRRDALSIEFKDVADDLNKDMKSLPIKPAEKQIQ